MTFRIAYLIDRLHVDPSSILAVTFTNKAAGEMQDRVRKLLPDEAMFLQVKTFHSFCSYFLRREASLIGYPASFAILDEDDQKQLVKNIASDEGFRKGDPIVKSALYYIDKKKSSGLYPDDINATNIMSEEEKLCLKFYEIYEIRKQQMFSLDFDDLILQTILILRHFPEVRDHWAHKISNILVDEYQDTNDQQYELIQLLSTPSTSITVVGDPDQTIYTWRGANQKIILRFAEEHPGCRDIVLNQNYRSTEPILNAANALISHNKQRIPKDLFTKNGKGEPVALKRFDSDSQEAHWVVDRIQTLASKEGDEPNYRDIAVLYRSSYLTRPFEKEFGLRGIPYRIYGGLRFYQRQEVKDCLAYFRLIMNPMDDISFERIVNVPKRSIGDGSLEKIRQEAQELQLSEFDYVSHIVDYPGTTLPSRVIGALNVLVAKIEACKEQLKENLETYGATLRNFLEDIGYFKYLAELEDIDEDRIGNVNSLFDDINSFISNNPESTFDEYLQNISLLTAQDDMNGGNYVSLMTVHTAKGLEFPHVFIIGLNEGTFPNARATAEEGRDGMEEERRLAYVAFTRAQKTLTLTTHSGYSHVTDSHASPSQFFKEAKLFFPAESFNPAYRPYGGDRFNTNPRPRPFTSFFSDGDAISPFEEKKSESVIEEKKETNGVTNWHVGDRAYHEKFGEGDVVEVIDSTIIVIDFDSAGKKTLLSTHKSLSRIRSKGGQA